MAANGTSLVAFDVALLANCTAIARLAMTLARLSNAVGFHKEEI